MATSLQNLTVPQTIEWLLRLGRPPLPECPIEAAKQGKEPKQPCFLDGKYLKTINWKQWQDTQPLQEILDAWFSNPKTGIGTLGGWNGKHWLGWIDFDRKDFPSSNECDRTIQEWLETYPVLEAAPMFRTPSGGYRFLIAFSQEPENFKANSGFSLKPDGSHHVGELLSKNGGHTLLPPTVGVTGSSYEWVRWSEYPPVAEQPEDIGVYPVVKKTLQPSTFNQPSTNLQPSTNFNSSQLGELLEQEIYPRLTPEILFSWSGHNFKEERSGKLKGSCPWHDSKSGTAFYTENIQGQWVWRCPACDIGGGPIAYRHRLAGGNGSPRGRDFVDLVRELAQEVGLSMPELNNHTPPGVTPSAKDPKTQAQGRQSTELKNLTLCIETLIDQGLLDSELEIKFWELAQNFNRKPHELRELYKIKIQEQNRQLDLIEDEGNFNQLSKFQRFVQEFDWKDCLPPPLYKGLSTKAEASRLDLIILIQHLLPALGGLIGGRLGIVCQEGATEADNWVEYPIIWSAIVAPPSSGKTNAERTIFNPIRNLQEKENKRYQESKRRYLELLEDWNCLSKEEKKELRGTLDDPDYYKEVETGHCQKFLIDEGEIEAVKRRISEQSERAGLTWNSGEFLKLWNSLDQHKKGKGSARPFLLDAWSGPLRGSVDRVNENESFCFKGQALSLCGGIQPGPAAKFFNSECDNADEDGLWSRMLLAVAQFHPEFDKWSKTKVSLDGLLTELYLKALRIPSGLLYLSPESQKLWESQWEAYRRGYRRYLYKNPAFSYFLGKMGSHLMRLALLFHTLEHCCEPKLNFFSLGSDTFKKAVRVASYYIAQFRLCQMQMTQSPEQSLSDFMMQILNLCLEESSLTATRVVNKWRRRGAHGKSGTLRAGEVKELFETIAKLKPDLVTYDGKKLTAREKYDQIRSQYDRNDRIDKPLQNERSSRKYDHTIAKLIAKDGKNGGIYDQKCDRMIVKTSEQTENQGLKDTITPIVMRSYLIAKNGAEGKDEVKEETSNLGGSAAIESEITENQGLRDTIAGDRIFEQASAPTVVEEKKYDRILETRSYFECQEKLSKEWQIGELCTVDSPPPGVEGEWVVNGFTTYLGKKGRVDLVIIHREITKDGCIQSIDQTMTFEAHRLKPISDTSFHPSQPLQSPEAEFAPVKGIQEPEAIDLHTVETLPEIDRKKEIPGGEVESWTVGDAVRILKTRPRYDHLVGKVGTVQEMAFTGLKVRVGRVLMTCEPDELSKLIQKSATEFTTPD